MTALTATGMFVLAVGAALGLGRLLSWYAMRLSESNRNSLTC